ncbi:hydroxypyruvate isomerase family protein [Cellulomonas sp. KRMCY2]|uniref:hydroxypyruvate isomerase family protein n=1 Tax=Cellulomonas sp. KRMCY2 TaxID=1304865 RepID=UPI00045E6AF3|nr:TIM barrel protein [Cellulomonas sp. KRMCY2]
MTDDPRIALNCSMLFKEYPLLDRPRAARDAGYAAVEFWWPFAGPEPTGAEVSAFIRAIEEADVELVALNLFAGDMANGDRGILSHADRLTELEASLRATREIAEATGVQAFNALHGLRDSGRSPQAQHGAALDALAVVAASLFEVGGTVLLEAVSGIPDFPLATFQDCVDLRDGARRRGHTNIGVLADLYHLAANGDDVNEIISTRVNDIAHVQIADLPGRHEPGTGQLPLARWVSTLRAGGYEGWIGLEYNPEAGTAEGLKNVAGI